MSLQPSNNENDQHSRESNMKSINLEVLDISLNSINCVGILSLFSATLKFSELTSLNVSFCDFSIIHNYKSSIKAILENTHNLEKLYMSHCKLSDEALQLITFYLNSMKLRVLDVSYNNLTGKAGEYVEKP